MNLCSASKTITVCQPTILAVNISSGNVSCNGGNNGYATATVTGGTAPYSYSWSNSGSNASNNNLTAGTYTLTVTDAKGCTVTSTVTITEPTVLSASTSKNDVSCNGGNNGSATIYVNGGTAHYS